MLYHSLGVLSPTNCLRRAARAVIRMPCFDRAIDVCILVNCVCLALRNPAAGECAYAANASLNSTLLGLDIAFTAIFLAELSLKLVVHGAYSHPGAYLRDGWNWIDAFVAVMSLLGLLPRPMCSYLSGLSALRAVRLLRTLRTIKRVRAMPGIVQSLLDATPKLFHVCVMLCFIFIVFGILGVQVRAVATTAPHPNRPTRRWR